MNMIQRVITSILIGVFSFTGYSQSKIIKSFDDRSGEITDMRISPDTKYLAVGNKLGIVTLWDYSSGKEIFKVRHHKGEIKFIFFHPISNELVVADGNEVVFFDLSNGEIKSKIGIFEDIDWMDVSPVDDVLFVLASLRSTDGSEEIYKVNLTSRKYNKFYSSSGISKFKVSPDGKQLFLTKGKDMDFLNIGLQIVDKEFDDHLSKIRTIDINPNDPAWMVTTDRSLVRYWQTTTGKNIPFNWSVKNAFLMYQSKILTTTSDSLIMRDYKVLYGNRLIKAAKDGIKGVMVNDERSLIFVLTNTNKIEVYPTGLDTPLQSQAVTKVSETLQKIEGNKQTATQMSVKIDDSDKVIYSKYKTEIETEIGLKADLFLPRGEFEKSTDYEGRQAEAKSYKDGIISYYKDKLMRAQEMDKQLALTRQRYIDSLSQQDEERKLSLYREKIKNSYEEFTTGITSIGTYHADREEFPITIDGVTSNVKVPIENARDFKSNYKSMKVVAMRQLLDDAKTTEVFNMKVVNVKSGSVYNFGKQKPPLYLASNVKNSLLKSLLAVNTRSAVPEVVSTQQKVAVKKGTIEKQMGEYLAKQKYYALLIGVNDYQDPKINALDNPVNDALRLKRVLQKNYTFEEENITLLKNPTRTEIIESFDKLSSQINKEDNLIIFYAGHGIWDERLKQGFWLPKDSRKESKAAWLSNGTIRDYLGGIKSKHTLLIADACFSGGIFKTRDVFMGAKAVLELYKLPSRKAMTSGNMKTVPDKSVFMEYLIKRLNENQQSVMSAESLFSSFRVAVINNSSGQVPQYGDIRDAGDEGGDFVFLKRE